MSSIFGGSPYYFKQPTINTPYTIPYNIPLKRQLSESSDIGECQDKNLSKKRSQENKKVKRRREVVKKNVAYHKKDESHKKRNKLKNKRKTNKKQKKGGIQNKSRKQKKQTKEKVKIDKICQNKTRETKKIISNEQIMKTLNKYCNCNKQAIIVRLIGEEGSQDIRVFNQIAKRIRKNNIHYPGSKRLESKLIEFIYTKSRGQTRFLIANPELIQSWCKQSGLKRNRKPKVSDTNISKRIIKKPIEELEIPPDNNAENMEEETDGEWGNSIKEEV